MTKDIDLNLTFDTRSTLRSKDANWIRAGSPNRGWFNWWKSGPSLFPLFRQRIGHLGCPFGIILETFGSRLQQNIEML